MLKSYVIATAVLFAPSCDSEGDGDDHDHGDDDDDSEAGIECSGDEDAYDAKQTGEEGNFTIELVKADPEPHTNSTDSNTLEIVVTDADGEPVEDVDFVEIKPFTPAHGMHGTPIIPVATAGDAPGEYVITDVNYVHMGPWELRFDLEANGKTDHVVFTLCIADADED